MLVWIHGGAFFAGSGIDDVYNGAAFARDGVVAVTLNYRLGAQGFWHLGDQFPELAASGNLGMLDQVAALEWVQENIAAFGGDPGKVTIAGESAGGMSVGTLLAMPRARGLFRRAIPQSGAGHNGISAPTASMIAGHMLDMLGVGPGDLDASCPRVGRVAPGDAAEAERRADPDPRPGSLRRGGGVGDVLPTDIRHGAAPGPSDRCDRRRRGTRCVGDDRHHEGGGTDLPRRPQGHVQRGARRSDDGRRSSAPPARAARTPWLGTRANRPGAPFHELVAAVETDRMFTVPAIRMADAQVRHNPDLWMYRFDWRTPARGGAFGAHHFLEVPFAFDQLDNPQAAGFLGDARPRQLAAATHSAWVSFVKDGDPNNADLPEWPRYDPATRPTMLFDEPCRVESKPNADEIELWDGVL